jgi:hypothetical protein
MPALPKRRFMKKCCVYVCSHKLSGITFITLRDAGPICNINLLPVGLFKGTVCVLSAQYIGPCFTVIIPFPL